MSTEIIKIEEFTEIMKVAPDTIKQNTLSSEKCVQYGQALLDTVESNGGKINSDELDVAVAGYIEKTKLTLKNMNERRKGVTQILTQMSKVFTSLENEIDPLKNTLSPAHRLQQLRNNYASEKLQERNRIEQENKRKLAIENEKIEFKSEYKKGISQFFNNMISDKLNKLQEMFNSMSLQNFDLIKSQIVNYHSSYDCGSLINSYMEKIQTYYIEPLDKMGIRQSVINEVSPEFKLEYSKKIGSRIVELSDLFQSKYVELKELDEAFKKDAAEFQRLQQEQRERERAEFQRLQDEQREREKINNEAIESNKQAQQMTNLFDLAAANAVPVTDAKIKVQKKIKIASSAGFVQVYNLWFQREGMNLPVDDLEKLHKKMITFCEKLANGKEEELIKSPYIEYIDDVKAK